MTSGVLNNNNIHWSAITSWPSAYYRVGPPFESRTALTRGGRDSTRPLKVCCGGTKTWAAGPLSPESCEVGPPWVGLVYPAHPIEARWHWDLGNLEAKWTPWHRGCVPQTILAVWQDASSCCKRPLPLGSTVSMERSAWPLTALHLRSHNKLLCLQ